MTTGRYITSIQPELVIVQQTPTVLTPPKEFFRQFLNLHHNRVLFEDFPHEKLLTIKYKGSAPSFIVNAKGSLNFVPEVVKKEKDVVGSTPEATVAVKEIPVTSAEVSFLTSYAGKSTAARFNNKGIMRFWTNWGKYDFGQHLELITVLKSDTNFKQLKAYVAAGYQVGNLNATTRLQVRHVDKPNFSVAEKVTFDQGDVFGGVYGNLDLSTASITQYNALLGYHVNRNVHFYAEHVTVPHKANDFAYRLGKLSFSGVYKDPTYWGMGQIIYNAVEKKPTFLGGIVYNIDNNTSIRAKVNENADLTIGTRFKVNKNFSLNIGTFATLKNPEKIVDTNKTVPVPFGVQLEFSF